VTAPTTTSRVLRVGPAAPAEAHAHFARRLEFETDCSDVHHDLAHDRAGFVVLDARSAEDYAAGHVPGAWSVPHVTIDARSVTTLPRDALLVTYCWGPHCNGATQAAAKLAALGFRVKEMLGGYDYWCREGYPTEQSAPATVTRS
jgi:rhodanese-related sulfurtransferase